MIIESRKGFVFANEADDNSWWKAPEGRRMDRRC